MSEPLHQSNTRSGLSIKYQRMGHGPPLILLHGFICDSRAWRSQIDDLSDAFDVIAWDAPGCGASADPPEEFAMSQFAGCLLELMDGTDVSSAHLLGLSWGGTLALEFHRQFPARTRSLIVADSYAGWTGSLGEDAARQRLARCLRESELPPDDWVPEWVPEAFSSHAPPELQEQYGSIMRDFHPVGFRAMSRALTPDFSDTLQHVTVPTLLIWGAEDSRSPLSCGEMMRDGIPGARLVIIPGAGHLSNMEQPERFNSEVRAFLQATSSAPP